MNQPRSSRKPLLMVVTIFVLVIGAVAYQGFGGKSAVLTDGLKPAPAFELPRSDGKSLKLSDLKDHVLVVHFWAAWCPPCIPEITEILAAAKRQPKDQEGRPIYWVFISQDPTWEKARSILRDDLLPENAISLLDSEAKVSDQFGSYQFPETYLVNRAGGITAKWIGALDWSGVWGARALAGIESLSRLKQTPRE